MRSKLFGRLMSFTLSATVALTSGIPALAYDGGGGDLPEEDEEIQLLEEEEIGSDFDASEFEEAEDDIIDIEEADLSEEPAEFAADVSLTIEGDAQYTTAASVSDAYDAANTAAFSFLGTTILAADPGEATGYTFTAGLSDGELSTESLSWTLKKYDGENLVANDLGDYGLTTEVPEAANNKNFVIKIASGSPQKAMPRTRYALTVTDGTRSKTEDIYVAIKGVTFLVVNPDGGAAIDSLEFASAKKGYAVVDPTATGTDPYTKALQVKVKVNTEGETGIVNSENNKAVKFEWATGDANDFAPITWTNNGIYNGADVTATLRPLTDRTPKTYSTKLKISSDAIAEPILIPVTFTVTSDLAITGAVKADGKDASISAYGPITYASKEAFELDKRVKYLNENLTNVAVATGWDGAEPAYTSSTPFYVACYDLGEVAIGETIKNVAIKAEGGEGKIVLTPSQNGAEPYLFTAGITTDYTETTTPATFRVTGKALNTTRTTVGAEYFVLAVGDKGGAEGDAMTFKMTVTDPDVEMTLGTTEFNYGDDDSTTDPDTAGTNNKYTWFAAKGYKAENVKKTITIKNNSENSIKFDTSIQASHSSSASVPELKLDKTSVTVAAGSEATLTVSPVEGIETTKNAVLKIAPQDTDTALKTTEIALTFTGAAAALTITNPTGATLDPGYYGKNYSFVLGATLSSDVKDLSWKMTSAKVGAGEAVTSGTAITALLKTYGLKFSEETGAIVGTPKSSDFADTTLTIKVKAVAKQPDSDGVLQPVETAEKELTLTLTAPLVGKGVKFTAGGVEALTAAKAINLGTVTNDKLEDIVLTATITNDTEFDFVKSDANGVKVALGTTTNGADYFDLVLDDNDVLNDDLVTNGFTLKSATSRSFKIKAKEGISLAVGEHTFYANVLSCHETNPAFVTTPLYFKVKVVAAPVITAPTTSMTINEALPTDGLAYSVSYTPASGSAHTAADYTFAWTQGSVPGLTLSTDGKIKGTPTAAGDFDVTVTVTNKKDSSLTATKTHTITVLGTSTINISGISGITNNTAIILPGMIQGDEASTKATFKLNATSAEATNLTITVEDAADNRISAEDIRKSPANPYAGSSNYIDIDTKSLATLSQVGTQEFKIVSKGTPAPGLYKVKITIKATNSNTIVLYAIMPVVEKFSIVRPNDLATKLGTNVAIQLKSKGGADDATQAVTWSEGGTSVTKEDGTTVTAYYVTNTGAADGTASDYTDLKTSATGAISGILGKAGNLSVTIKAEKAAMPYSALYNDDMSNLIDLTPNLINTSAIIYPKQVATAATFTISAEKSDRVNVSSVSDTAADAAATRGKVEGTTNGNKFVTRTGYTYKPVTEGYDYTAFPTTVEVKNNSLSAIKAKGLKAAFSKDSKFEFVSGAESGAITAATLDAGTGVINTDGGTHSIVFRPVTGLKKGVYTDTLTISGDNFQTIAFAVTFTVEDNTYLVSVDNIDGSTINNDKHEDYVLYVDKSENKAGIDIAKTTAGKIRISNAGNTAINNVKVVEVKANGTAYGPGSSESMLTNTNGVIATIGTIAADNTAQATLAGSKSTAGVYNTYISIHYEEGTGTSAVEHNVIVPVTYTKYTANLDAEKIAITPSGNDVAVAVAEGYTEDGTITFTIKNNATGAENTIRELYMDFEAPAAGAEGVDGHEKFAPSVTSDTKIAVKPGETKTITVKSLAPLSEGTYSFKANVKATGMTTVTKNVTFKVSGASVYTVRAVGTAGATVSDAGFATKLYNSLWGLSKRTTNTNPKVTFGAFGENKQTATIEFDGIGTAGDVTVQFTGANLGTASVAENASVSAFKASVASTNTVEDASKAVALSTEAIAAANEAIGKTGAGTAEDPYSAKHYTSLDFNFYGVVEIGTTDYKYAEKTEDIKTDNLVVEATVETTGLAKGKITATVPYGSKLGTAFKNGKLPTAIADYQASNGWRIGSATGTPTDENLIITKDYLTSGSANLVAAMHKHKYAPVDSENEQYVKWVWTKDASGNRTAVLHLYCYDPSCPSKSSDRGEIIVDSTDSTKYPNAYLVYGDRTETGATCDHGAGYKYTVTAIIANAVLNNANDVDDLDTAHSDNVQYVGEDIESEVGEPLGHLYNVAVDPVVKWTDANEDGLMTVDEVKVTRACTRATPAPACKHVEELKIVRIDEKDKKEPTCTKDGSVQYVIVYTEIDENGKAVGNEEIEYKEVTVLKATGHSEELLAEVTEFDDETFIAKKLTLTCTKCNEVLFSKENVQFVDAGDGTFTYKALIESTGQYYNVSYTNHAHVWKLVSWTWTKNYAQATLRITCEEGKKPEYKEFVIDSVETVKGAMHIYTVEKTYTWTEKGVAKTATFTDSKQVVKADDGQVIEDIIPVDETQGIYIEGLEEGYYYTGAKIQPAFNVIDASEGIRYLAKGVDYKVTFKNNKEIGSTATVKVEGKGNYTGQATTATFKILDPMEDVDQEDVNDLSGAKITFTTKSYQYTGSYIYPDVVNLKLKGQKVATAYTFNGTDYVNAEGDNLPGVWTVSNNLNKGTATFLLSGKKVTKGNKTVNSSAKATYSIKAADLSKASAEDLVITVDEKATWAVKGAIPAVSVEYKGILLIEGQDYKVQLKDNKKLGTAATVTILGKGNFTKKAAAKNFEVTKFDLAGTTIAATTAAEGVKASAVKATVFDADGNVIPAKLYTVTVTAADGSALGSAKLTAGQEINVKVEAKGAELDGSVGADFTALASIKSAKVAIAKGFAKTYTGEAIELDEDDMKNITVTIGPKKSATTLVYGEDFTIVGYTNNVKKGSMTVTIAGIGEKYSGTKTFKVKIAPKPIAR